MRLTNLTAHDAAGARFAIDVAEEQIRRTTFHILATNVLCSLATVSRDLRAHINTAHFCYSDDLELYILSHPRSQHCQNLVANSSAAVTVFSSAQPWLTPGAGLQLFGTIIEAQGAEAGKAEDLYARRFPAYHGWKATRTGDLNFEFRFYRFVVSRLKVLDEAHIGDGVFISATVTRN